MKRLFLLLIAATMAHVCLGQVRFDNNAWTAATNVPIGSQAPIFTVPYASVTICTDSSCASLVSIYSNQALSMPIAQPFKSDSLGRYGFWAAAGTYWSKACSASGKCQSGFITLGGSGGGGSGTVTSVGLTLPNIFSVTGSPVTTAGTIAASLAVQSANQVFAGPASGSAANPAFRALVSADIPAINLAASGNGGVTGLLPNANLVNTTITVNGTPCTLGSSCTPSGGGGIGGSGTTGFLPLFTGASTVGNSHISDIAGTLTISAPLSVPSGASITPSGSGTVQATNIASTIAAGTNVTITGAGTVASPYSITASATGSTAFSALTGSTNTTAAMLVGTGASLAPTGSGTVTANAVNLAASGNGGVTGLLPHANIAATAVTAGSYTSANITVAADGSITAASNGSGGGSGISGQATGVIPLASTATTIGAQSHIDDGVTTAGTLTASEPIAITGSIHGITIPAGTAVSGAAGKVVYTSDATSGLAEVNENNTGLSRVCTATNGVCTGGGSVSITSSTGDLTVSPSPLTGTGTIDLNLGHANTWTANQTAPSFIASGSGAGVMTLTGGTAPGSIPSNSVDVYAPATVSTPYGVVLPTTAPGTTSASFLNCSGSSTVCDLGYATGSLVPTQIAAGQIAGGYYGFSYNGLLGNTTMNGCYGDSTAGDPSQYCNIVSGAGAYIFEQAGVALFKVQSAARPSGACSGTYLVFSASDGHVTWCNGTTYVNLL